MKGAPRTLVVQDNSGVQLYDLCWLPDRRIVYSREEAPGSDHTDLWQIAVDSRVGTPTTKPKRITQWGESQIIGLSANADGTRLVLRKEIFQGQVYLAQLEGRVRIGTPRRLTNDEAGDGPTAWTADSKTVLFMSFRNGKYEIFKQGISDDTAEPLVTGPESAFIPRLSPDGKWVIYASAPPGKEWTSATNRLMRVPLNGGSPELVLDARNYWDFQCSRSPATLCVVLERSQDEKRMVLTAFDPLKGRGQVLLNIEKDPGVLAYSDGLSPDGSTFALAKRSEPEIHIRLFSLSGGPEREITIKTLGNMSGLDWAADGRGMYCASLSSQGGTLFYTDLKGTSQIVWQNKGSAGSTLDAIYGIPSPDSRYLAIRGSTVAGNVWMLERF